MKLKTTEKGFTLLELLVALSIAAFVTAAASMTIITMMRLTPKTNNWAIALRQVQNAGYWISRDVLMADNITVGDTGNPMFLTLRQPQIDTSLKNKIEYKFEPMSGGLKRLVRTDTDNNTAIMIAEYISSDNTTATYSPNCTDNCTLTFTITAISGNVPVTRQYEVTQRVPASSP
jgi:prepilin-type N-terminal cleavage/methylation domain-containing protein